jgi:hypothetical protein
MVRLESPRGGRCPAAHFPRRNAVVNPSPTRPPGNLRDLSLWLGFIASTRNRSGLGPREGF